jgi:hypothetical protein
MGRSKPFLRETPIDKAFRYRGVIAVVSVPVLLIVLVAGLMPRAAVDLHDPHPEAGYERRTAHLPHSSQPRPFRATAPGHPLRPLESSMVYEPGVRERALTLVLSGHRSRSSRATPVAGPLDLLADFASGLPLRAICSPVDSQR